MSTTTNDSTSSESRIQLKSKVTRVEDVAKKNYFGLFPDEDTLKAHLPNSFIYNKPMSGVGGDGYWLNQDDEFLYLAVFDCMGHGHLASMMTRIYTNALKKVVVEDEESMPGVILHRIHEEIHKKFENKENRQLGTGADFGIIKINSFLGELEYAGAKMDLLEVSNGELNIIKADRMQVGEMFEYDREYKTEIIDLKKRDACNYYLSSDGVKDLFGGSDGKKLGSKNIKALLENNYKYPMNKQKEVFTKFFEDWNGTNIQLDDILMIGFTI